MTPCASCMGTDLQIIACVRTHADAYTAVIECKACKRQYDTDFILRPRAEEDRLR